MSGYPQRSSTFWLTIELMSLPKPRGFKSARLSMPLICSRVMMRFEYCMRISFPADVYAFFPLPSHHLKVFKFIICLHFLYKGAIISLLGVRFMKTLTEKKES